MEIEEHGFFQWAESDKEQSAVAGILTISSNGVINLELHETLAGRDGTEGLFPGQTIETNKSIIGILKSSVRYVKLSKLVSNGSQVGVITYEKFIANECFISDASNIPTEFSKLLIPLNGLEEWTNPGNIDLTGDSHKRLSLELELAKNMAWDIQDGKVEIRNSFSGKRPNNFSTAVNISLISEILFTPNTPTTANEMISWYSSIQDLLGILTGTTLTLPWPKLYWINDEGHQSATCYYPRLPSTEEKVLRHSILIDLGLVQDTFGSMIDKWLLMRKSMGPGISLYLGTRRNFKLYKEHRFVNLVWGLESLDRRTQPTKESPVDANLKNKIERINDAIKDVLNSKDRKWLSSLMTSRCEPSLEERLYKTLEPVAIEIKKEALKTFCKECANLRNDLSHFGGERTQGDYQKFISRVSNNIEALSNMYLLLILNLIGISSQSLRRLIYQHPNAMMFLASFRRAELIEEDVIRKRLYPNRA